MNNDLIAYRFDLTNGNEQPAVSIGFSTDRRGRTPFSRFDDQILQRAGVGVRRDGVERSENRPISSDDRLPGEASCQYGTHTFQLSVLIIKHTGSLRRIRGIGGGCSLRSYQLIGRCRRV